MIEEKLSHTERITMTNRSAAEKDLLNAAIKSIKKKYEDLKKYEP